ncbi:hypothetical protein [Turicimonas muris]|uniref:hypothetical protein n=1 Tax=Turicimonas muris TaxID=1796652 RepID=UPI0023F04C7F|nr:hypothetical protein [Turicimonas muris]
MKYFIEEIKDIIFRFIFFATLVAVPMLIFLANCLRPGDDPAPFYGGAGLSAVACWAIYKIGTAHGHVVIGDYNNPEKKPVFNLSIVEVFRLDSMFKRSMFVASVLCLLIIGISFVYEDFSWRGIQYHILSVRRSKNFLELVMAAAYWLFPFFIFLMFFGEKIISWIRVGSKK